MTTVSDSIFAVIVNWNGGDRLSKCLASACEQGNVRFPIILVDNASTDGSEQAAIKKFEDIELVRNSTNLGFAAGANTGIRRALSRGAKMVFILNPDVLLHRGCVDALMEVLGRDETIGVIGPAVHTPSEVRGESAEFGLSCSPAGYPIPVTQTDNKEEDTVPVLFVPGCTMLIRSEVFHEIGFFDESYFLFAEDLDFCWRVWLSGKRVVGTRKGHAEHESGGSLEGGAVKTRRYKTNTIRLYLRERNTLRTILKNYAYTSLVFVLPTFLAMSFFEYCIGRVFNPRIAQAHAEALKWNVRHLDETVKLRSKVQRARVVSDLAVLKHMRFLPGKLLVLAKFGVPLVTQSPVNLETEEIPSF